MDVSEKFKIKKPEIYLDKLNEIKKEIAEELSQASIDFKIFKKLKPKNIIRIFSTNEREKMSKKILKQLKIEF